MTESARGIILNAGCGGRNSGTIPALFGAESWSEVRLDISPANEPDIISSIVDMRGAVADASVDVLYSSHAVEHLYAHEVIPAFREFRRVVRDGGFALVTCPDLAAISRFILTRGAEDVAYESPAGPIRPIDMLYGHSGAVANGALAMAHNTGFTGQRLARVALSAGFSEVRVFEGECFDLWGLLLTPETSMDALAHLFDGSIFSRFLHEPLAPRQEPEPAQPAAP